MSLKRPVEAKMAKKKIGSYEFRYYELPEDFPILALMGESWIRCYDQVDQLHFHNHLEIGHCISGHGTIRIEEKVLRFEAGSVTIIPANVPHATNSDGETLSQWEYLFIDIERFLKMIYANNPFWVKKFTEQVESNAYLYDTKDNNALLDIILQIMNEISCKRHYYREYVKGLIVPLLVEINRIEKRSRVITTPQNTNVIAVALEYIGSHYMEDIKIGKLAEISNMSESHFRRVFGEIVDLTLDYINTVRIRMSCVMLCSTYDSVSDIALRCGFPAISTFNRNFYKVMGTTPLKWRNDPNTQKKELKNYEIKTLYGWLD